jgi:hypothetical protein
VNQQVDKVGEVFFNKARNRLRLHYLHRVVSHNFVPPQTSLFPKVGGGT